ncbi:Fibulin-2 [Triplophysa tibetana]|uniref:Fibulin-2 n=1 Tax=Triplophysa tibetana TaxID=1572043 RepID=A0A5A9NDY1_9TELE|nr:Fibulin-2 [Triplophysa tibetana]
MASHLLNLLLLLSTSGCLCQKDCTGVDCPVLDKCIEEVLETGACCATCKKTGCLCEGYQYYDCTSAGFRNGKVPEGESYFVDFGSTECSCPQGGGRISCHYMPCPEIPANCIELTEPADGCIHCERFGCVHGEEKYEAGHSVQTDPCQVCHCPGGGGELMCYPIPNCDPNLIPKPVHVPAGADGTSEGLYKDHLLHVHQGSRGPISKLLPAAHNNNGPLNLHPSHIVDEEEDEEDYDYPPTDYLDPSLHGFASPTKSSTVSLSNQQNFTPRQAFHRGTKQELREMLGIHKSTTDRPHFPSHKPSTDRMKISTHKDKPKEENFLKYKTDLEQFILPVETTNRVGISSRKETTQSFSLYKEHSNQEDLTDVDSNTNNEHLAFPKETSEGDIYNLEDDTTTTESSTTLEQTSSQLWETTASSQTAWNGVSESQIYSVLPNTVEADISKREESITAALNQTTIHDGTQPAVVEGNKNILNSLEPVQQSVTASGVDSSQTLPEHGKSPFEPEKPSEEHKQLSATHIADHVKIIENHKHPTEELVRSSGDHKTKSERKPKWQLFSPEEFTPTSLSPNTQSHSLFNFREEQEEADNTLSSHSSMKEGSIESCCAAGQKWEEENQHCNFMPVVSEDLSSVCSVVQKQCCSGALRESRCQAGINVAKAAQACEEGNSCGEDSQKDCCSCCALGLRLRREGKDCKAHRYLSYPCGHVFLACCEDGEEGLSTPTLKKKERPEPTATPKRVSDGPFPKQALSAGEVDPAANSLEDLEHEDRCQRFGAICHHACINTHESYLCVCHPGYRLLQDARTCVPENQEEDNRVSEEDQVVTVSPAQQETSTETPVLHNPCAGNGPCAQRCTPIRGLAHCSCFPGYFLMVDGHTCEDIDECVVRTHNCGTGFECQNTDGSFTCNQKQRCLTGFTQDSHGNCLDIDECSSVSEPCTSGFNCINTVGSYTCQRKIIICSRGYHSSPDGARCVDVDECQTSTHRCGQGQICHNLPGSYRCDCQTGYQYDSIRKLCVDVNECWRYPGRLCAQTCENTPGSYQCSCTTGFSLAFDGKNCEDLNECDSNPCGQECANIYGSYQCYCRMGYYLKEDGHTCEDIDECSQSIGNLCAFQCENVPGSYKCACPPHGYTMSPNGRTCEDIDECAIGSHNCSASQTCFNIQGGFRCLSFTCPENYKKVSDTRCERLNCPNFQQCQTMPSRITYYQMSFQTNIVIPAQIFRIGPSPAYSGDNIIISIPRGNEEGFFSTRKLNSFTGAVYLHRQMHEPRDFLIDVEMKLLRQGTFTTFLARIYVFITPNSM